MVQKLRKYGLLFFLILQIAFYKILQQFPDAVEKYYSQNIFSFLGNGLRKSLGGIPFSVGDCIYLTLIFLILRWIIFYRKRWRSNWQKLILAALNAFSVFYFLFHVFWGFNYYRLPLSEKMNLPCLNH